MAVTTAINLNAAEGDYPFQHTRATKMLADGLNQVEREKQWNQRAVAKLLNYKTAVVLSHMAAGRVPIPIDRAPDIARVLKLNAGDFIMAVLEQRHPEIDWARMLSGARAAPKAKGSDSFVATDLEALAGAELDSLPQNVVNVLRDVVTDRNPSRRWMSLGEVPIVEAIRNHHPAGLTPVQRKALDEFLAKL
ncbi:hypothetical protein SAMN03159338_1581 [Sphingomonas sp. NFR04]|jgi:DNA-binding transcriptional regulator YdaS (Cro superfamily)|uniref:hypothetical protein n=1 Tax=Sphingomonas sp. NFR04 TaxID=1566283 RepID=UPI0008F39E11|nr:hypothetical protein [Sphingomonas sp. NFR04]SFJ50061.1 hypothetical protein SAMN03159338_1581 [Sphingomonas sp. NFR04]